MGSSREELEFLIPLSRKPEATAGKKGRTRAHGTARIELPSHRWMETVPSTYTVKPGHDPLSPSGKTLKLLDKQPVLAVSATWEAETQENPWV